MAQSAEEKRRAPRHPYAYSVTYMGRVSTPEAPHQEVPFQGKIVDLSNGGLGMQSRRFPFLEIGSLVRSRISMPSIPVNLLVLTRRQWVKYKGPSCSQPVIPQIAL